MKIITTINIGVLVAMALLSGVSYAYDDSKPEEICKKPHFRDFTLEVYKTPEKKEVSPEAEFSFTVSPWANPETIKLAAKGKPIPFNLVSNSSFHRVTAKLPAEYTNDYVRLNVRAVAYLGCHEETGWLVKVAGQ
ncbi:MAG: hypothetical protein WC782_11445 [Methylococcaceae bacterium]